MPFNPNPSITCPCPRYVLPRLISILISHGATVSHSPSSTIEWGSPATAMTLLSGTITHGSGTLTFHHVDNQLTVTVSKSLGHFPPSLLIGGIRQLIEETVETVENEEKARLNTHSHNLAITDH